MFADIIYSYKVIDAHIQELPDTIISNYRSSLKEIYNCFADPRKIDLGDQSLIRMKDCREDYLLGLELGSGNQGKIYIAQHRETLEKVAIKEMEFYNTEYNRKNINVCIKNGLIVKYCIVLHFIITFIQLVIISVKLRQ